MQTLLATEGDAHSSDAYLRLLTETGYADGHLTRVGGPPAAVTATPR